MIKNYLDTLAAAYPAQIVAVQNAVDLLMPYALIGAGIWGVWLLLLWIDRWIDRSEERRTAQPRGPQYRTADARQMEREIEQLWHQAPNAGRAFWEPWHETMPPAEPAAPRHRLRAGAPTVVPFPSKDAQQQHQQRRRQP